MLAIKQNFWGSKWFWNVGLDYRKLFGNGKGIIVLQSTVGPYTPHSCDCCSVTEKHNTERNDIIAGYNTLSLAMAFYTVLVKVKIFIKWDGRPSDRSRFFFLYSAKVSTSMVIVLCGQKHNIGYCQMIIEYNTTMTILQNLSIMSLHRAQKQTSENRVEICVRKVILHCA